MLNRNLAIPLWKHTPIANRITSCLISIYGFGYMTARWHLNIKS